MGNRKHSRVAFPVEANIRIGSETVTGTISNLSMNGMFFLTEREIPGNDPVEITIPLSGSEIAIHLKGRPIRRDGTGTAIQFCEIDLDSFTHLKNIVSYNSGNPDFIEDEYYKAIEPE
jgi:hypothetical protein